MHIRTTYGIAFSFQMEWFLARIKANTVLYTELISKTSARLINHHAFLIVERGAGGTCQLHTAQRSAFGWNGFLQSSRPPLLYKTMISQTNLGVVNHHAFFKFPAEIVELMGGCHYKIHTAQKSTFRLK